MLAYDPASYPLNNNDWAFPVCEIIHILGFALSIGTVALVDLRLLGLSLKSQPSSKLLKETAPWTLVGLFVMLVSGPLIFFSDPAMYLRNQSFRFKMGALLLAILFNYTIHWKVAKSDPVGSSGAFVGALSLALWTSVVAGGLFIAFV
jgi:hypothetical protein